MLVLGFRHRLGGVNVRCQPMSEDRNRSILQGREALAVRSGGRCCPWMLAPFKGHKDGLSQEEYHWNYVQSSWRMCIERAFGMLKGRWRILLKRVDVYLKSVPELVTTCLVLHNICIIFGDNFWKNEWMQEAMDEVHNGMSLTRVQGTSTQERLAVANHALHSLARIDDSSRESLEYNKQKAVKVFQIAMGTGGETSKEL